MNIQLEESLKDIKILNDEMSLLQEKISAERQKVFDVLESENIGQYKCDIATVSYTERKTIKYQDKEMILNKIVSDNLPKYFNVFPEEIIPEHKELNKDFENDIKNGIYKIDGVDVETKKLPMIRFNK